MVENGEPASSKVVMPLESDSSMASVMALLSSSRAVGGGALGFVGGAGGCDDAGGAFAEESGGIALGVLEDFAAGGVGGLRCDAGELEGLAVDEAGVAAGVGEDDGVVGRDFIERGVEGEAFDVGRGRDGPLGLMPAAADDPLAGLGLLDGAGDLGDDIVPGAGFAEVEAHAEFADAGEVAVAFDEARDGELAMEIDDFGVGPDPTLRGAVGAEGGNFIAAHRDGLRGGRGGIHGDDLAVAEDEVRGLGKKGGGGKEEDGCAHGD